MSRPGCCNKTKPISLSLCPRACHPKTCAYVRLLGPCFKTGRQAGRNCYKSKSSRMVGRRSTQRQETQPHSALRQPKITRSPFMHNPEINTIGSPKPLTFHKAYNMTRSHYLTKQTFKVWDLTRRTRKECRTIRHLPVWQRDLRSPYQAETPDWTWSSPVHSPFQPSAYPINGFTSYFNPLSKVLFIFPSRYLFAIGLVSIFSLGWCLPPHLSCIPKQLDSPKVSSTVHNNGSTGLSPFTTLFSKRLAP